MPKIGYASFDRSGAVEIIYVEYSIHTGKTDDNLIFGRQSAPRQRRPSAARHGLNFIIAAIFQYAGDFLGRFRKNHGKRNSPVCSQCVRFEGAQTRSVAYNGAGRRHPAKAAYDSAAAADSPLICVGHSYKRHF